jgi:hypothetical protein
MWQESKLFTDIHNAILDDGYLWIVVHGPPRSSKTSLAFWASYSVYEDWDKVLRSCVFNLSSVLHRIQNGIPEKWPTVNGLHTRVPLIIYDDFGVFSNKADTQHSLAFDIFKGSFDALGTELGVLIATMVNAEEATIQLQNKYNIEVVVNSKGHYKYDSVSWQQDFRGFRTKMKKTWIENGEFDPIPQEVYKEYDVMRHELVQEAFVRIKDAMAADQLETTLRLIKPVDIDFLRLIDTRGPIRHDTAKDELGDEKYKMSLTRCKARSLIISTCQGGTVYKLDMTSLGKDVLDEYDNRQLDNKKVRRKPYDLDD